MYSSCFLCWKEEHTRKQEESQRKHSEENRRNQGGIISTRLHLTPPDSFRRNMRSHEGSWRNHEEAGGGRRNGCQFFLSGCTR
jgi:hypothetical protein